MATLVNDRNNLLYTASSRVTGASVSISPGAATTLVVPKGAATPVPASITLTASVLGYITPAYVWAYRFGTTGSFTTLAGTTNPLNVTTDSVFLTSAGTNTVVQYQVTVTETTSNIGINQSQFILTVPILREGTDGLTGLNSAVISLYARTATNVAPAVATTGNAVYTFSTGVIIGQPSGWSTTPPSAAGGAYLWTIQLAAAATTVSYTFANTLWPAPVLYTQDGTNGTNGVNGTRTAILDVYQWATVAPTTFPSGTSTYTWATGQFSAPASLNSWTLAPSAPVTGQTLWVARTVYSDTATTATSEVTWNANTTRATGAAGTNGTSTYSATVYQQSASAPATPVATASTYNFSTSVLTPPAGWSISQPATTTTPTYACDYTFSGAPGATVTGTGSWSTPYIEAVAGSPGSNGEYRDIIQLYLSSGTAPTAPTSIPYTFSTNTVGAQTGGTAGWSLTRPTATTTPLYVTTALAATTTPAVAVTLTTWTTPVIAAQNGTNGQRVGILEVYQWATIAPTSYPSGTSTYTWATGVFTAPSTPNSWSLLPGAPTAGQTLWAISVSVSDNSISATSTATWNSSTVYAVGSAGNNGSPGSNGLNTALVYAYKRAVSVPTDNPGNVDYDFTNKVISTTTLANSWLKTIPAGTNPLYVTLATASNVLATDSILAAEWSSPVLFVQNGTDGTNGINGSPVYLYARNNSSTTAPSVVTTGTATYTFATGVLSGTIPTGWTQALPAASNGGTLWAIQATAASNTSTDTIANTEWSTPAILAQNGTNGTNGTRGSRDLYSTNSSYTSSYVYLANAAGSASYAVKATDLIAAAVAGSVPLTPIKGDTVTFSNGSTYVYTITYNSDTSTWETPGTVVDGSLLVTGSVTASKVNSNGLTIRDSNGNLILGAGVPLDWSVVPSGLVASTNIVRNGSYALGNSNNFTSLYTIPLTTTSASSTGGTATVGFASQAAAPYLVGETITLSGITPTIFNGNFTVTACTTTSVSFALSGTNGPQTVAGTVYGTGYLANDGSISNGCIYKVGPATLLCDDYIPVDNSITYTTKVSAKSVGSPLSVVYLGVACYDKDRNFINHYNNAHYTNTETTLAADLVSGATTITVTSAANWQSSAAAASVRYAGINIDGYKAYTYAKLSLPYASISGNVITLTTVYTGITIKSGTSIANYYDGNNYNYNMASAATVLAGPNWTKYTGTITPIPSGTYPVSDTVFRHGTAYVKVLGLLNYGQTTNSIIRLDDWSVEQSPDILSSTVSVNAVTGAGFRAGNLTWDSAGNRTSGSGVAMTPGGLVGHNGTDYTFSINASTGSATFKGDLTGASGTFSGNLSGGQFTTGGFTGYAWPSAGTYGSYLGPSGLLLGNANNSKYFQVTYDGNIYAPGFSVVNGTMTVSQANVINTLNITGNAVTIPVSAYTAGSIALAQNNTTPTVIQTAVITLDGNYPVMIISDFMITGYGQLNPVSGYPMWIHRNGVLVGTSKILQDSPGAGTHTYTLSATSYYGTAEGDPGEPNQGSQRALLLLATKR